MKKLLSILLCVCMVLSLAACGSANTAPAASSNANTEDTNTNDAVAKHEPYHISIAAGRPGDTWFMLSHALSTFINDRSDWLTAEVVSTAGITDNTRLVVGDESLWDNYLICTMLPVVKSDVWNARMIAMMCFQSDCLVTLDPNMTLENIQGKNVALPRDVPYGNGLVTQSFLTLAGITEYNALHGGNGDRLTALQDGAADVGVLVPDFYYPDTYVMGSGMMELASRGTLYFPTQGRVEECLELYAEACRMDPFVGEDELPTMVAVAPAGSFGEGQTEDVPFLTFPIYLAAGDEMPEDVIKEVLRIYYDAAGKGEFADYHACGVGITPEFCAFSPWDEGEMRDKMYHPAALEFYEEVGQEIKTFSDLQASLVGG